MNEDKPPIIDERIKFVNWKVQELLKTLKKNSKDGHLSQDIRDRYVPQINIVQGILWDIRFAMVEDVEQLKMVRESYVKRK